MQRRRNAGVCGFAGDGAAQKIDLGLQLMANVVQHRRRMIGLRADLVHLPRIFVELDAQPPPPRVSLLQSIRAADGRDRRTRFHAAKCGECGSSVSAETPLTEALKISFGPLRGTRILQRLRLSGRKRLIKSAASFTSANGVWRGSNGPIQVAVSSSYCTMRVAVPRAAHESGAANDLAARVLGDDLFASQPILRGENRALIEIVCATGADGLHSASLLQTRCRVRIRGISAGFVVALSDT